MKKVLFLCVLLSSLSFIACGDDDDPKPELDVAKGEVPFEAAAGETTVNVTSNTDWTATSDATDWCTVTPPSGTNNGTITIKVTANPEMRDRSATVTVKSTTLEKKITVKQDPASLEALLVGEWEIIDQTHPEPAFDVMEGITFEFNADKTAVAVIDRILTPELPEIGTLEGTWSVSGMVLTFSSEIVAGLPIAITCEIDNISADAFTCTMKTSMPGLLPPDGLPIVVEKVK